MRARSALLIGSTLSLVVLATAGVPPSDAATASAAGSTALCFAGDVPEKGIQGDVAPASGVR